MRRREGAMLASSVLFLMATAWVAVVLLDAWMELQGRPTGPGAQGVLFVLLLLPGGLVLWDKIGQLMAHREIALFFVLVRVNFLLFVTLLWVLESFFRLGPGDKAVLHLLALGLSAACIAVTVAVNREIHHQDMAERQRRIEASLGPLTLELGRMQHDHGKLLSTLAWQEEGGDSLLEILLKAQRRELESRGFAVEMPSAPPPLPPGIQPYAVAVVLANLVENAGEVQRRNGTGQPSVSVRLEAVGESGLRISAGNKGRTIDEALFSRMSAPGFTTKADKQRHGYGFYAIKRIADRNGGKVRWEVEGTPGGEERTWVLVDLGGTEGGAAPC
ncbi:ATP-binding protein [Anaerotalea alkaliphila]|uniref:GHKL domain-containing protein n=1 Tax=Anaerotalea alkaliphila TaxID=2662126 RepID=A0A7X5HVP2_9FIRM|nr:ATP-binding protein [Anaerotalea alkaliphila]NDL67301.1 GHKL domain-containing protein [Anaerotalea alkaliphila]